MSWAADPRVEKTLGTELRPWRMDRCGGMF